MLKVFNKIRQNSLVKGKLGRYLLYAAGEIVLVVIGILLALQINTWNENRKESALALKILKNLEEDVRSNAFGIRFVYSNDSIIAVQNKALLGILADENAQYHDSLQVYFGRISRYNVFSPKRMAYEALKSKGSELIQNDSLRAAIIMLYDETYPLNDHMLELKKDFHMNSRRITNEKLFTMEKVECKVPVDFQSLKSDHEFRNNLSYITAESENFLNHYTYMLTHTVSVHGQIQREIARMLNE